MFSKKSFSALLLCGALLLSGCQIAPSPSSTIKPPTTSTSTSTVDDKIISIVNKHLPQDSRLFNPKNPLGNKAVVVGDIDGDKKDEIVAVYKSNNEKDHLGLIVLKEMNNKWTQIFKYTGEGFTIDLLKLSNITSNTKKDIVVGWALGSITNGLDIFTYKNNKLEKITKDNYYSKIAIEDMPDINGNKDKKDEIALWAHDTGEAYIIDVLRYNGSELVPAKDVYPYYFKNNVVGFYEQKVKEMPDAAFYWYYLADAQLKAGDSKSAITSAQKGLEIKKKHPDYYPENQKFEEIIKQAEKLK